MELELAIAVIVATAIAVPHLMPLHAASPGTAAAIWFFALALRALAAVGAAAFVFGYLPQTETFAAMADWCWALVTHHLGLSGHPLAHAAVVLPALTIACTLLWVLVGLTRAGVALWLLLARRSLGRGPMGSIVVAGGDVIVAATGIGRARVVVSQEALGAMDSDELEASVAHELGHIRRRHRPLLLLASGFGGLARLLPGTRAAQRGLAFSLERDADEYAVRATSDPLALASAICKAARPAQAAPALVRLGGGGRVGLRLSYLVGDAKPGGLLLDRSTRALAMVLAAIAVALVVSAPAWALAPPAEQGAGDPATPTCRGH